jgi:hypothetical protein
MERETSVVLLVVTHNKQLSEQSTGLLHKQIIGQFLENPVFTTAHQHALSQLIPNNTLTRNFFQDPL